MNMLPEQPHPSVDASFQHLQLELARLDVLLHRQIQRFHRAAQLPPEAEAPLGRFYMTAEQAMALLQRPFGASYAHLPEAEAHPYTEALATIEGQIGDFVSGAEAAGESLRLHRLATLLGLDRFDLDTFLIGLATQLDGRFSKLYAFLQDDLTCKRPSVSLALDLLCPATPDRLIQLAHFSRRAPLLYHQLIDLVSETGDPRPPLIDQAIYPDESVVAWLLLGQYLPPTAVKDSLTFVPQPRFDGPLLAVAVQDSLLPSAATDDVLVFTGRDDLGRESAAHLVAQQAARPLLTLDLAHIDQQEQTPLAVIRLMLRDALLTQAIPHVTGWDACLVDEAPPPALLETLCAHPGLVLISSEKRWQARQVNRRRRLRWFHFPLPDTEHRARLLTHFGGAAALQKLDLTPLAGQFQLTAGQLRDLVNTAQDMAAQDGRRLGETELFAAARAHSNPRLATLARKITPRYTWADLILPEDQVQLLYEMVNTIRSRHIVLEKWGVGRKLAASAGVTGLFFGPPGTGKTMAAEVIAGELRLDLYKIDLSTMVSKYIGETEKNLERIFTEAESSNAILFFDEADAIFGKRSEVKDAHDRYANIEISYLLQRMEMYNGVTILATNLRANLDEAFMRRLQFALSFPFPKAPDRLRIWQTLLPSEVPQADNLDLEYLAKQFEISGGNIRNIIIGAAYLAATNGQQVSMDHLLHSTRRELQKMGRLVNERDLKV